MLWQTALWGVWESEEVVQRPSKDPRAIRRTVLSVMSRLGQAGRPLTRAWEATALAGERLARSCPPGIHGAAVWRRHSQGQGWRGDVSGEQLRAGLVVPSSALSPCGAAQHPYN